MAAADGGSAVPTLVEAKFDFAPSNKTELRLIKGAKYRIVKRVDENWYSGKDAAGATGIFPISYVVPAVDLTDDIPQGRPAKCRRADLSFSYERQRTNDVKAGAVAVSLYNPALPSAPAKPTDRLPYHVQRVVVDEVTNEVRYTDTRAGRTAATRPPDLGEVSAVHIFDVDETLIQFNHLGSVFIPPRHQQQVAAAAAAGAAVPAAPDRAAGKALSAALEKLIFDVATRHFFFDDLEGCNQTDVRALAHIDDRAPLDGVDFDNDGFSWPKGTAPGTAHPAWTRLAHRLRAMGDRYTRACGMRGGPHPPVDAVVCSHTAKHAYEKTNDKSVSLSAGAPVDVLQASDGGWVRVRSAAEEGWAPASYLRPVGVADGFPELAALEAAGVLSAEHVRALADVHRDLAAYTEGWLDTSLRLLHALQHVQGCEVVLVTSSELSAALAKCLLFRLAPHVRAENVYSSATAPKTAVFRRILERFGAGPHYCAYGDGPEEARAAADVGIAFRPVASLADLQRLCRQAELNDGRIKG